MVIMVSGGSDSLHRFRQLLKWPLARSTSARVGKGIVTFASTDEVLPLVYRPNLSVRDVCREAAIKVKIHPVSLDFFTLVSGDASGLQYLDPNKRLCEAECYQTYKFRLCIKACHVAELIDLDKEAFDYYFHQCREDFLSGKICEFENDGQKGASRIRAILFEITYIAKQDGVCPKTIIGHLPRKVEKLCKTGILQRYELHEIKKYFKKKIEVYDKIKDIREIKRQFITCLEKADDFFVYKLAFEEMTHNIGKRCDILVSAEFGIKKRIREDEANSQEYKDISIVQEFSEIEALDLNASHEVTIYRTNFGPERLKACSPQAAESLLTLIEGYYKLMVNQYKPLRNQGHEEKSESFCHGPIQRHRAEYILNNSDKQDGLFLIRKCRECFYTYIISLYHGGHIKHFKIKKNSSEQSTTFALESDESRAFSSLSLLIEHYKHSKDGLPVNLTEICKPQTKGLSALLDRASLVPAPPDASLVDPSVIIPLNELTCGTSPLSKGEFGELKRGSWRSPNCDGNLLDVVLRAVVKPVGRKNIANFQGSTRTFLQLKHHYLLQLYGITETQRAFNFVFEFAERGLDDYIKAESEKTNGITKRKVLLYAAQIAEGMMFLHSKEIVHGRLNAHNVLFSKEECIKISDYGLLHLVENGQVFYASGQDRGYDYCWYSPNSLQLGKFTMKDDIWSFGMTLWEILIMKKPYHCSMTNQVLDKDQVLSRYLERKLPNVERPNIPTKVGELIQSCWAPISEERPDFRSILSILRSDELVPEKEALENIHSVLSELEDWEIPTVSDDQLELQMHTDDSEVSNVDYSYLTGGQMQVNANGYARNLPGITMIPSASVFNTSIFRKESVSKTFSHPDLIRRIFGTEISQVSKEASSCLLSSKTNATRPSSCPPAIEASNKKSDECPGRRPGPGESTAAREFDLVHNGDSLLPSCPFLSHPESQIGDFGAVIPVAPGTGELSEAEYNTDDSGSNDGQDAGFCAEALAMRALGGIAVKASMSPSNSARNVGSDEGHKTETLEEMLGHDSLSDTTPRLFVQTLGSSAEEHAGDNLDTVHHKASFIPDSQGTESPQDGKVAASPYAKLCPPQPASDFREQDENFDHFAIPGLESTSGCLTNTEASRSGSKMNVRDSGVIASSNVDAGSSQRDSSEMETTSAITEVLPLANSLCSKTADESLACFTNVSCRFFEGSASLSELLLDAKEDNSCTLITDLHDDIESNASDSSSRDDAETSLCRMFESGRNRSIQETHSDNEKVLNPGFQLGVTFEDCDIPPQLNVDNSFCEVDTQGIELQKLPLVFDNGLESIEMVSLPLNNLSKEYIMKTTEPLHFKDEMSSHEGLDLNFFEDTCSNDGCLPDGACEAGSEIPRSISEKLPPNPCKVSKDESRKGEKIPSATDHPVGNKQSSMTVSKASNKKTPNGYRPTTEKEPIPSTLSRSQSSEGIWPCSDLESITVNAALGKKPLLDLNEIDEKLQIKYEELRIHKALGQGNFGKVRKATWVYYDARNFPKKEEVAVKSLRNTSSDRDCSDFIKEIKNMVKLQSKTPGSPYVIKLRGVSQDNDETMLVTELAPLGALDIYLRNKKDVLGTKALLNFCVNICKGMAFLESHKMLHRDLAARNILVMTEDLVKISDFGLSRHQEYYRLKLKTNEEAFLPRKWYAPECLRRQSFSSKSDVWSFAVTIWEIFTFGDQPYMDMTGEDLLPYLEKGSRLSQPNKCPDKVFKVMQKCWEEDPHERPTFYLLKEDLQECLDSPREPQL